MWIPLTEVLLPRLGRTAPGVNPASFTGNRAVPILPQAPIIEKNRDNVFD
jgi:hypothetical protein